MVELIGPDYLESPTAPPARPTPKPSSPTTSTASRTRAKTTPRKRAATLALLKRLKAAGVPIDALGIQSHISRRQETWGKGPARAHRRRTALGLEVYLTELDVNDDAVENNDIAASTDRRRRLSRLPLRRPGEQSRQGRSYLGPDRRPHLAQRHQKPQGRSSPTARRGRCLSTPSTSPRPHSSPCATPSTKRRTGKAFQRAALISPRRFSSHNSSREETSIAMTLTRRDFTRLSALGLAARFAPALNAQSAATQNRLRRHRPRPHCRPFHARRPAHHQLRHHRTGQRPSRQGRPHRRAIRRPAAPSTTTKTSTRSSTTPPSTPSMSRCPTPCMPSTPFAPPRPASMCSAKSRCATNVAECRVHDRRLQRGQRQAHDRLPLPLRAHQPQGRSSSFATARSARSRPSKAPSASTSTPGRLAHQQETRRRRPALRRRHLLLNACRYLTGEEPVDIAAYRLHHRPRRPLRRQWKRTSPGP